MKTSTLKVSVNLANAVISGTVDRIEGQNAYITDENGGVFKFHVDQLEFLNDVQAKAFEKMTGRKVPKSRVKMGLSEGNKKLKDSAVVAFYQWNITSVKSCPFRTEMCEALCYAKKAERMYPTVNRRREQNLEFSKSEDFVPAMIEQIEFELARKKNKGKTVFFRIHEAGDFYDYAYTEKWHQIAAHFKGNRQIVFMAYTKSLPFVKTLWKRYGRHNVNITFKSSIWADTKPKFIQMTRDMKMSIFTAEEAGTLEEKGMFACPSSEIFKGTAKEKDCGQCKVCYVAEVDVAIEIH